MALRVQAEMHGARALIQQLQAANTRVRRFVAHVMTARLLEAVTYARQRYLTGGTTGDRLGVRTGALRASFGQEIRTDGARVIGTLGYLVPQVQRGGGDPLRYAVIHEGWPNRRTQTTIRAKPGKALAIPTSFAKTPAGVPRGRPRDFPHTFIAHGIIWQAMTPRRVRGQRLSEVARPLFILKQAVTIPARPALYPTVDRTVPLIEADLRDGLAEAILPGGAG